MLLKSEEVKIVVIKHYEGEGKNGSYNFNLMYYNLKDGLQESIRLPEKLKEKAKLDKNVRLILENNNNYLNLIDIEEVK